MLLIDGVVDNNQISLRIREEFQALRSNLLAAVVPPEEETSPVEVALRREMYLMKRENLALAKENKRDVQRKKELDKI